MVNHTFRSYVSYTIGVTRILESQLFLTGILTLCLLLLLVLHHLNLHLVKIGVCDCTVELLVPPRATLALLCVH